MTHSTSELPPPSTLRSIDVAQHSSCALLPLTADPPRFASLPTKRTIGLLGLLTALGASSAVGYATAQKPTMLRAVYGLTPPSEFDATATALVLIDFQEEFYTGGLVLPTGRRARENAGKLLAWARQSGLVIVHVRNLIDKPSSPLFRAGSPQAEIVPELRPYSGELVITKSTAGAFTHTDLNALLTQRKVNTLVVAGLMTHLAISATAIDASVLGYRVVLAADAMATRSLPGTAGYPGVDAAALHRVTLVSLADRFADVALTHEVLEMPIRPSVLPARR